MSASRYAFPALVFALLIPLVALAQSDLPASNTQAGDLRSTIRAELLKDPRAAQMSQTEFDTMVNALTQGATAQGMTPYDIAWRPAETRAEVPANADENAFCAGIPGFLCAATSGFGFDGSNTVIPIALFFTSGLLLFLLYELKHHHRHDAEVAARASQAIIQ